MLDELDKILGEEETETPKEPSGDKPEEKNEEAQKKEQELTNLNKAIAEAQLKLKDIRKAKKQAQSDDDDDDLPSIDMTDPSAQAWDKHIKGNVNTVQAEIDQGKEERRNYALSEFLRDKPNLSKSPEKVKELIATYEKIRTASEMTTEGIVIDLRKAYAATYSDELIDMARVRQVDNAKADAIYSDIAVSRGSTSYSSVKEKNPQLDEESKRILAKWGMSETEWQEDYKKYKN